MALLMLFFFVHSFAHSEVFTCPDGTMSMEYELPGTNKIKKTCGYLQNGQVIKHGPEVVMFQGKVIESTYFNNGKVSNPLPPEENKEINLSKTFKALTQLLSILSYDQGKMNHGKFNVAGCDSRPFDWVVAALKRSDIAKAYSYSDKCDISGEFRANFRTEFVVDFNLRNLDVFKNSKMKVKMTTKKGKLGIRYRFEVIEGSLSSEHSNSIFKAEYEVDIDSQTGNSIFSTQEGRVSILKMNEESMLVTRELKF